jgi:hypothetical protein
MKRIIIIALIVMMLASCGQSENPTQTEETKDSGTELIIPTATPIKEFETSTLTPSLENLVSPTVTPTQIPLATLTTDELNVVMEIVLSLLNDVENCVLPCFMGIRPGLTTWPEIIDNFSPTAYDLELIGNTGYIYIQISADFSPPLKFLQIDLVLDEDQTVTGFEARTGQTDNFSLSQILSFYGKPDEIRVGTWASGAEEAFSLQYYLFYAELNTILFYNSIPTVTNDKVQICPSKDNAFYLIVWTEPSRRGFIEIIQLYEHRNDDEFPQISEISSFSNEEFFETFKDGDADSCIILERALFEIW